MWVQFLILPWAFRVDHYSPACKMGTFCSPGKSYTVSSSPPCYQKGN